MAVYVCEHCGVVWSDADRLKSLKRGEWKASAEFNGIAGFRLSGLNSPWIPLTEAVRDFLEAKKLPETLRVWVNTYLGETWEETGEGVADEGIADRREEYEGCPEGVVLITAGVDVQDDGIECEIVGWGRDEESWSLGYQAIYGDPSGPAAWGDLGAYLNTPWHTTPVVSNYPSDRLVSTLVGIIPTQCIHS
ncbi:MAG: terminase gpA endonuclease subunit [Alphaproteobacteria bacterium]